MPLSVQVTEICRYLQLHSQEARILLTHFNADDSIIQTILASRISAESVQYADYTHIYDEDARKLLNRFLSHGIYNLIRCWLLDEINKTPEDIGALAEDIALHGWIKSSD